MEGSVTPLILAAPEAMNRMKSLILWLCIAYLRFVVAMDLPSVPAYIPSAPEELDDLPELSVFVGGMHSKGLYRLGSWKQPFVNKIFMNKLFKPDSFAILRQQIVDYNEASGLFSIQVAFPNKEKGKQMLETIIQFFSEYGQFLYRDLLVAVSYNQDMGDCFILKFRDQVFADEVRSCIGNILAKSFEKVYLKKVLLPEGSPIYFSAKDLLPLSPLVGPSWNLYADARLVEEMQRFSQALEYMHYISPLEMIPSVTLCNSEYIPGETAAVQVRIVLKGLSFPEQVRHIYLLFSYLLPDIQADDGNVMLKKFLHMKTDVAKSNVELYLSFRPDVDLEELKKEINFKFFKVLIKDTLGFSCDWKKFKLSNFSIEGSTPRECNIPHMYQLFMRDYFKGDKKRPAILKFSPEPIDVKCLLFFKTTFKLDSSVHIGRLFSGLYELLGRHAYDNSEGFHLMEIRLSPVGSKDDFSIQLTYANMNNNYGTIIELFTAILRGCGIQSVPFTKILKSLRPGSKESAIVVPASVEKFTTKSIAFDAKDTGAVRSLFAAFDKLSPIEQEVFKSYFPEEITGIVQKAGVKKVMEIVKEDEKKTVKPQQKPKQAITKKQAKKLRAAHIAKHVSPPTELMTDEAEHTEETSTAEPVVEEFKEIQPEDCAPIDDLVEPVSTMFTKTKKIKASKKRKMEAREKAKQQQSKAEASPEAKQDVKEVSLQQLIEDLVSENNTKHEPALKKNESSVEETVADMVETEIIVNKERPELSETMESDVMKSKNPEDETSELKVKPAPKKSYAAALLGTEPSSEPEVDKPPPVISPILGPVIEQPSIVLGPVIQPDQDPIPSEWYTTPLVMVTPKGSDLTFAVNAGTWDMYRGGNMWWSPFWQQHMAIHVIRKKLYATPRPSNGPSLVSLVIAVPEHACDQLLENMLMWIETDPSAYIRHRTLSVSLVGSRFNMLPETQSMNQLVFTLRYPDDPVVSPWLDACARILKANGSLAYQLNKESLFAPTQFSDLVEKSVPLTDNLFAIQKWSMIYNGVPAFESQNLTAMVNALKCLGPQRFVPLGVVHRSLSPGERLRLDYNRTVSIAPTSGLPAYSVSALFNFFLRLLDTVQHDIEEPVSNWMVPVLAHLECFHFVPIPNQGTYALYLQLDQLASPEIMGHANLLAVNWSMSLCLLKNMRPLNGKTKTIETLQKAAKFQYAKSQSETLHFGDFVSHLREYVNEQTLHFVPEAMVVDFGRSQSNRLPKPRWILSQVCLTNMPIANIIHFITELYYLPRWSPMIGHARRIWVKRIAQSQFIVGFAVEEVEGAMENIPVLTRTLVVNSLLVAVTDLHISETLETMEKLEASFAATISRMTETSRRINEQIQSTISVEENDVAVPEPEVVPEAIVSVSAVSEALEMSEQPKEDHNSKEPEIEASKVAIEEIIPELKENAVLEPEVIVIEAEEAVRIEEIQDVDADIPAIMEQVPEEPVAVEVIEVWPKTLSTTINFKGFVLDCSYTLEEPLEQPIVPIIESEDLYLDISKIIASLPKAYFSSGKFLTISRSNSEDLNDCVSLQGSIPASEDVLEAALKLFESAIMSGEVPVVSVQVGPHGTVQASFQLILKPTTTIANINSIKNSAAKSIRWSTSW